MKKQKFKARLTKAIICLAVFIVFLVIFNVFNVNKWIKFALYLSLYIIIGYKVIIKAIKNLFRGQVLDENFLMTIASIGALCLSDFSEAVAVLLFYEIGEIFQSYAVNKTRKSIADLMQTPDMVTVERNGELIELDPYEVEEGEILVIRSGEKVAIDGEIVYGQAYADAKALTGESVPYKICVGDKILSGIIINGGLVKIKTTKTFENSTISKICEMVQDVSEKKSKAEQFITRFSKYYTPIVVGLSFTTLILSLIFKISFKDSLFRALTFLVISCPCALVISVPISFFGGIASASRQGILIKGSVFVENMANASQFVFDKTGTLTKGEFKVISVYPEENRDKILKIATICESVSVHPIAESIKNEGYAINNTNCVYEEIAGKGIKCYQEGREFLCGNLTFMLDNNINCQEFKSINTLVYVAENKNLIGVIEIGDELKEDTKISINQLNKNGNVTLLSGDRKEVVEYYAKLLKINNYKSQLLPNEKAEVINEMVNENNGKVVYVGDGINDTISLASSDVGISMGIKGADVALEYADIVLMKDKLSDIIKAKKICKKTMNIVKQNIVFSLGVKVLVMILSAFGFANMWLAVFADVGVAFIAILNAMRTFKKE